MKSTEAIVLAGGLGTRLRSVVSDVPKPLAPIHDRPFLAYLLDSLAAQGIRHVVLAVGYKGELIETCFGESHKGMRLSYSFEPEALGTGGAVQLAMSKLRNATREAWILNGDTFFDCRLGEVAQHHVASGADVSLALHRITDASRYGLVELDENDRIVRFCEKTPGSAGLINAGIYLLRPHALLSAGLSGRFSLERDFFEDNVTTLHLNGAEQSGYFVDIGVPEDYARAQQYFAPS